MTDSIFGFDPAKVWDYENGYYLTSDVTRLTKAIAQYELYKSIVHLPGDVMEFGVFKGASMIRFCTYREALENRFSRKIIGFDAFGKFPDQDNKHDKDFIKSWEQRAGDGISVDDLHKSFKLKGIDNYELVEGDIIETLPAYLEKKPYQRVALLHIDVDVYKPTKVILEQLFERVVKGGLIVFDDYNTVAGESDAVDEFFANTSYKVEKLPLAHIPAFVRK